MFNEMDPLLSELCCSGCFEDFDEPKCLPCCGEVVCLSCVDKCLNHPASSNKFYKCLLCMQIEAMPHQRTFTTSRKMIRLLQLAQKDVYRSGPVACHRDSIEQMNFPIPEMTKLRENERVDIDEHFRNDYTQLQTELLIEQVNRRNEPLLNTLSYQEEDKDTPNEMHTDKSGDVVLQIKWRICPNNAQINDADVLHSVDKYTTAQTILNNKNAKFIFDHKFAEFVPSSLANLNWTGSLPNQSPLQHQMSTATTLLNPNTKSFVPLEQERNAYLTRCAQPGVRFSCSPSHQNRQLNIPILAPETSISYPKRERKPLLIRNPTQIKVAQNQMTAVNTQQNSEISSLAVCAEFYEKKLTQILETPKQANEEIFEKIEKEFSDSDFVSKAFVRGVALSFFRSCFIDSKIDSALFKERTVILTKFIGHNEEFELESLFAAQALDHRMKHLPGFIRILFDMLCDEGIVREDVFWKWKRNIREEGHQTSALSLRTFFEWLNETNNVNALVF